MIQQRLHKSLIQISPDKSFVAKECHRHPVLERNPRKEEYCGSVGAVVKRDSSDATVKVIFGDGTSFWLPETVIIPLFGKGDEVSVVIQQPDKLQRIMERTTGWKPEMAEVCGASGAKGHVIGSQLSKSGTATVRVDFNGHSWFFPRTILSPSSSLVRISENVLEVMRASEGHGGWNPNMRPYCGQQGLLTHQEGRKVEVKFGDGEYWYFNHNVVEHEFREGDQVQLKADGLSQLRRTMGDTLGSQRRFDLKGPIGRVRGCTLRDTTSPVVWVDFDGILQRVPPEVLHVIQ